MKRSSKLACLFSLWLLSGLFTMVAVNVTNGVKIDLNGLDTMVTNHRARLKSLYLWDVDFDIAKAAWVSTSPDTKTLDIFKGLIVKDHIDESDKWALIVVGWWQWNSIQWKSEQSGIAWGYGNGINAVNNAAIGGGNANHVLWENGVVAGWKSNKWKEWWVVLWWENNNADGVVLWWKNNTAGKNGLAMGQWAIWGEWSFVWNDNAANTVTAANYSARIWAQNGVLIGTYDNKDGVSLVVNWPVQIGNNNSAEAAGTAWEIRSIDGCLYAYDGGQWHILGKSSVAACQSMNSLAKTCTFGRVLLQEWDKVDAYSVIYHPSNGCDTSKAKVVCTDGHLVPENGGESDKYIYPSCYNLADDPWVIQN